MTAPMTAPTIGAAQNIHSCSSGHDTPAKIACEVDRAGLTDVFVTGIEIRWISVRHRQWPVAQILRGQDDG